MQGWSGARARVQEWTRILHEQLRATVAPFHTPQSPPPTPGRVTAPAELRAVHRLPIAEWHSEEEVRATHHPPPHHRRGNSVVSKRALRDDSPHLPVDVAVDGGGARDDRCDIGALRS